MAGVRVGDLLDAADPDDAAAWVQFRSITGYRWILPLSEARDTVLSTHATASSVHVHGSRSDSSRPAVEGSSG